MITHVRPRLSKYGGFVVLIYLFRDEATDNLALTVDVTGQNIDDVQNFSRNFLRGWWPHGSGRLVVFEAIEPTEEEATNERG